jgi:hypothetical protein
MSNEIDSLLTNISLNNFLNKVDKNLNGINFFDTTTYNIKLNRFFKIDLDKNGLTDLIVDGKYTVALLDKGKNKYQTLYIGGAFLKYKIDTLIFRNKIPLIIIACNSGYCITPENKKDTLIYKFESLIEYNSKPRKITFEEIKFSNSQGLGQNPIFELSINNSKNAEYNAIAYNQSRFGKYSGIVSENSYKELTEILNYIDIDAIKTEYSIPVIDCGSWKLEINYNGKKKIISNHCRSTFGLSKVYNQIFKIREELKWNE